MSISNIIIYEPTNITNQCLINNTIQFYDELRKLNNMNDSDTDTDTDIDTENICLITNERLTNDFIKLECGHKFNYIPLMNDLKTTAYQQHSIYFKKIKKTNPQYTIRCPYCRNTQSILLPYYKNYEFPYTKGIHIPKEELIKQRLLEKEQKKQKKQQCILEKEQKEQKKQQRLFGR